jgi:hypothetical protein
LIGASVVVAACASDESLPDDSADETVVVTDESLPGDSADETDESLPSESADETDESLPGESADETVVVSFDELTGAQGKSIVGVFEPIASSALGGFRVEVDVDPYSGDATVLADGDVDTLPGVSDAVLYVSPGTYTLDVWVVDQMTPYGYTPYLPLGNTETGYCGTEVVVSDGEGGSVTITGTIPPDPVPFDKDTQCTTK